MVNDSDARQPPEDDVEPVAGAGFPPRDIVDDDQGISLEELSRAYAALSSSGLDPYEPPAPTEDDVPALVAQVDQSVPEPTCELSPRSILEAMLFVGHPQNEPLRSEQVAALMRGVMPREINQLVEELNEEYAANDHPFHIVSVGAGYRLQLRDEFSGLRNVFWGRVRAARLSQAAVDTLAIVAYRQGLTREQIDRLRGRPSGAILSQLVRRQLLRMERPAEKPRRPKYYTTDRFLELFGLSSLEELPRSQEEID